MSRDYNNGERNKLALNIYFGMRAFVALSVFVFLFYGEWESAVSAVFILLLMITPSFLRMQYRFYMPFELDFAIVVFIFLSLFLGSLNDFYEKFYWWDTVLHFQSGILLGVVGFVMVYILNARRSDKLTMSPGFISVFAVCFSLALSVVWEIYEYAGDTLFGYTMQENGLPDTMWDFIFNGAGAIIVATIGYYWMRRRQKIPFAPRILRKFSVDHNNDSEQVGQQTLTKM
ncbi:MAG: hypothetical protein H6779_02640 [Candidatus Nomurabacteria bacterium]|nr:hypothetical protein [Candidatus Nomurabacteria bacterium]USN87287.1 MAG: hypothetical protein H6779_02640 [Candidatus Nomurabacteria bacterium]